MADVGIAGGVVDRRCDIECLLAAHKDHLVMIGRPGPQI
jgi:hypothetical protein